MFDAFNYPALKDTVAMVFVDGNQARTADSGDNTAMNSSTKNMRGRRFNNYSEQEFLESYLGKDYARKIDLS